MAGAARTCPKCGGSVGPTAPWCPRCGTLVASSPTHARQAMPAAPASNRQPRTRTRWITPVVIGAAAVHLSVIGFATWHVIASHQVASAADLLAKGPPGSHRDYPGAPTEQGVSMRLQSLEGAAGCREYD